jgi:hypothetical protein
LALVVEVAAVLLVLLPVLLLEVVVDLAHPAHKLLPLVLLQVAAVLLLPLPAEQEVAAVVLVQGLGASESLRSR